MRPCFCCGCEWACSHREPELLAWEYRLRRSQEALEQRAREREASISRKPPAIAPAVSIARKQEA